MTVTPRNHCPSPSTKGRPIYWRRRRPLGPGRGCRRGSGGYGACATPASRRHKSSLIRGFTFSCGGGQDVRNFPRPNFRCHKPGTLPAIERRGQEPRSTSRPAVPQASGRLTSVCQSGALAAATHPRGSVGNLRLHTHWTKEVISVSAQQGSERRVVPMSRFIA